MTSARRRSTLELRRAALALEDLVAAGSGRRAGARSELVDVGALLDDARRGVAAAGGRVRRGAGRSSRCAAARWSAPTRCASAQACGNLVANAVEHGGGPVRVRGRVVAGRVRVEVRDAGPGLAAPVSVLVSRRRRRGAARGRGLAIAARIAESNGGRLASAPSPRGACLVLELPSADAAPWPEPWAIWPPDPPRLFDPDPSPPRPPSLPFGPSRPPSPPPRPRNR